MGTKEGHLLQVAHSAHFSFALSIERRSLWGYIPDVDYGKEFPRPEFTIFCMVLR